LVQRDRRLAEQLQDRHEPGDHLHRVHAVRGQRREGRLPQLGEPLPQDGDVLGDGDGGRVQVVHIDGRRWLGPQHGGGEVGEPRRVDTEQHLGQQPGEALFQRNRAREPTQRGGLKLDEQLRDLLVGPVLQQPGEQQVAGLEQGVVAVFGVRLRVRQQPRGLEVEQGGRDDEELRGLVEVHVVAERGEVGDEVVGHPVQGKLGDVELVFPDQLQEQVERTGEVLEAHGEPRRPRDLGRPGCDVLGGQRHRARTSRASRR
jgi:hypothetical protein